MTDKIYINLASSSETLSLPANPPPSCKDVLDTLGVGTLREGDDLVLHSRILEAGKQYTFVKEVTAGIIDVDALEISKVVASGVVDPNRNFYVEAAHVGRLVRVLAGKSVLLLVGARQSGKTTDAQAVLRRLHKAGYQIIYVCLGALSCSPDFDGDKIWSALLRKLRVPIDKGRSAYETVESLEKLPSGKTSLAVVFDEVTSLPTRDGALGLFIQQLRSLLQAAPLSDVRLEGVMLVGTPALPLDIMNASTDERWSSFVVEGAQASQLFTETEIADLFQQIVLERNYDPGASLQEWAKVIMSATEGVKGLSGAVLAEIDGRWSLGQRFGLGDLVSYLSGKQLGLLRQGMQRPSMSLLRALTRNDDEMRCILTELICSGRYSLEDTPSEAALTLINDGVVKIVSSTDKKFMLQISAPILEQLLQAMALRDIQAAVQLPDPPMELGQRSFGVYLLKSAISLLDVPRLLQPRVATAKNQILEYALQHELSRALATVLKSNVKLASLGLVLGVEVRNREFTAMDAKTSQAKLAAAQQSQGQHKSLQSQQKSADEPLDGSWTEMPASQEQPAAKEPLAPDVMDILAKLLGSNTLQDRRLDMSVGPYGFELLSSGAKKEVVEHAARSILYADMHDLQIVFAVHVKVRRALGKQPRFPPWPDLGDAAKPVIPINVLIDVESGELRIMYLDTSEVTRIPLREEVEMLSGLEPPVGQPGTDRVSDGAASAVAPSPAGGNCGGRRPGAFGLLPGVTGHRRSTGTGRRMQPSLRVPGHAPCVLLRRFC